MALRRCVRLRPRRQRHQRRRGIGAWRRFLRRYRPQGPRAAGRLRRQRRLLPLQQERPLPGRQRLPAGRLQPRGLRPARRIRRPPGAHAQQHQPLPQRWHGALLGLRRRRQGQRGLPRRLQSQDLRRRRGAQPQRAGRLPEGYHPCADERQDHRRQPHAPRRGLRPRRRQRLWRRLPLLPLRLRLRRRGRRDHDPWLPLRRQRLHGLAQQLRRLLAARGERQCRQHHPRCHQRGRLQGFRRHPPELRRRRRHLQRRLLHLPPPGGLRPDQLRLRLRQRRLRLRQRRQPHARPRVPLRIHRSDAPPDLRLP